MFSMQGEMVFSKNSKGIDAVYTYKTKPHIESYIYMEMELLFFSKKRYFAGCKPRGSNVFEIYLLSQKFSI